MPREPRVRTTTAAVQRMLDVSGKTGTYVSNELDRDRNFISTAKATKRDVKLSTFCAIARACGFKVVAIRDSYGIDDAIDLTDIRPNNMQ